MELTSLTETQQADLARELADKNGPVAVAIALLEHAADLFKDCGKPRTYDGYMRTSAELRELIGIPRPSAIDLTRLLPRPHKPNGGPHDDPVVMRGELLEADFEKSTVLIRIAGQMEVARGPYRIHLERQA